MLVMLNMRLTVMVNMCLQGVVYFCVNYLVN